MTDKGLKLKQYSEEELIYNIINNSLSLRSINKYQILSAYICSKYIIFGGNKGIYGDCSEDRWLSDSDILIRQKHLTQEMLCKAHQCVIEEEKKRYKNN